MNDTVRQAVERSLVVIPKELRNQVLSRREKEVLLHVMDGKRNKEIAKILQITEGTVKSHVKRVMEKTQSDGRVDLIVKMFNRAITSQLEPEPEAVEDGQR